GARRGARGGGGGGGGAGGRGRRGVAGGGGGAGPDPAGAEEGRNHRRAHPLPRPLPAGRAADRPEPDPLPAADRDRQPRLHTAPLHDRAEANSVPHRPGRAADQPPLRPRGRQGGVRDDRQPPRAQVDGADRVTRELAGTPPVASPGRGDLGRPTVIPGAAKELCRGTAQGTAADRGTVGGRAPSTSPQDDLGKGSA